MGRQLRDVNHKVVWVLGLMLITIIGIGEAMSPPPPTPPSTPPPEDDIPPDNPDSWVRRCRDITYPDCYGTAWICPPACRTTCVVDCDFCGPVCPSNSTAPPPPRPPPPPPIPEDDPVSRVRWCRSKEGDPNCYGKPITCDADCPYEMCEGDCTSCSPLCHVPRPPSWYPPPHDFWTPPPPPTRTPSPTPEYVGAKRSRCNNRNYTNCYGLIHVCPTSCPYTCQVDCVTCKPVCNCDMPGTVCQDPRFIGGDGITFYFHGKKDKDFCLVTDNNLHINAHFIGKRNENMKRDFTWVQSIAILFDDHRLFVGARKTATWNDAEDRLSLAFDGEPIFLPEFDGALWQSVAAPSAAVRRAAAAANSITIEVEGLLKISAKVVPITQQESKIHNYGITDEDCFAHLELAFKFFSLTGTVNGVLGQTYGSGYVSRVKMGVPVPVIGGEKQFAVSSLFATDCKVSQFGGGEVLQSSAAAGLELPGMKCGGGIGGRGVICKR